MSNYIYYGEYVSVNDLEHYGVLGMKWGVHKGHANKAYAEGIRKKRQIDSMAEDHKMAAAKYNAKSAKYELKSYKKRSRSKSEKFEGKSKQLKYKAAKETHKAEKMVRKGEKWMRNMNKVFSDYDIKVIKNGNIKAERGRSYIEKYGPDVFELTLRDRIEHYNFDANYLEHYGIPGMKWGKRKLVQYTEQSANRASRKVDRLIEQDRRERVKEQHRRNLYDKKATMQRLKAAEINAEKGRRASVDALAKSRTISIKDAKLVANDKRIRAQKAVASYQNYINKINLGKTVKQESKNSIKIPDKKMQSTNLEATNGLNKNQNGNDKAYVMGETQVRGKAPRARYMNDRDLNTYINRLQNEERYNRMAHPMKSAIKDASVEAMSSLAKRTANTAINYAYTSGLNKVNSTLREYGRMPIKDAGASKKNKNKNNNNNNNNK